MNKIRIGQSVFLSLIIGLLFLNLPPDQEGVANINGLLFLLVSLSFTTATSVVMLFPSEIPLVVSNLCMLLPNLAAVPKKHLCSKMMVIPYIHFLRRIIS